MAEPPGHLSPTVEPRRSPRALLWRRGVAEVAIVVVALVLYGVLRVGIEGTYAEAARNAREVLELERKLALDWERRVQGWVLDRPFWIAFWNSIYQWLYWGAVGAVMILLWHRDRERYVLLRNTLLIAAAIGLAIWTAYPVAPPRFMGYVDTLNLNGGRVLTERPGMVNRYAAMPSFHVGWPAVAGVVVAMGSRRPWVWFWAMLPAGLLACSVVVTGNHFVLDIVGGLVVVMTALLIALGVQRVLGPDRSDPSRAPQPQRVRSE